MSPIDGDTDSAGFVRDEYEKAGERGRGVFNEDCSKVLVKDGVHLLGNIVGLMRCGWEVTGGVPGGKEILHGRMEQGPKSGFHVEKKCGDSRNTTPSSPIATTK